MQDYGKMSSHKWLKKTGRKTSRRKQGAKIGAFAVYTVRQSRARRLETTGFFGSRQVW